MFKILFYTLLVVSLSCSKGYSSDDDDSVDIVDSSFVLARLKPYTIALFHSNEHFEALIDTLTKEVFYKPRTSQVMQEFLNKVAFAERIYASATFMDMPAILISFTVEKYRKLFEAAKRRISSTLLLAETDIRDIFGFFAASKANFDSDGTLPDVWDWLSENLNLPYRLIFDDKGCVAINCSESFLRELDKCTQQRCMLAICLGFKTNTINITTVNSL